jgi:hypothetical protein
MGERRGRSRWAKGGTMRAVSLGVGCIAVLTLSSAAPATAAPIEREHYEFDDSDVFVEDECGAPITIDYHAEGSGVFMLKEGRRGDPTPYYFDNYSAVETFTANGKTVTIEHNGMFKDTHVEHVSGTIYRFTSIETGRPVVVYGTDGERLVFDAGRIRYTSLIDTKGDADLENDVFLEDEVEPKVAGPHPIFFEDPGFCDLIDLLR